MLGNLHVRFGGRALAELAPHPTPKVGGSNPSPGIRNFKHLSAWVR